MGTRVMMGRSWKTMRIRMRKWQRPEADHVIAVMKIRADHVSKYQRCLQTTGGRVAVQALK
jgi:hypothetical protein